MGSGTHLAKRGAPLTRKSLVGQKPSPVDRAYRVRTVLGNLLRRAVPHQSCATSLSTCSSGTGNGRAPRVTGRWNRPRRPPRQIPGPGGPWRVIRRQYDEYGRELPGWGIDPHHVCTGTTKWAAGPEEAAASGTPAHSTRTWCPMASSPRTTVWAYTPLPLKASTYSRLMKRTFIGQSAGPAGANSIGGTCPDFGPTLRLGRRRAQAGPGRGEGEAG